MTRSITLVLAAVFAVATAIQEAPAKQLTLANFASAQTPHNRVVYPNFMEGVTKDTDGAITFNFLPGGQLVSGRTTLPSIRDRVIDIGLVIQTFTRRELAANNTVFEMHFHGSDAVAVSGASVETVMLDCPQCVEEWRAQNAVYLGGYAVTPFRLFCREEVSTVADLAGKRVRSSGAAYSRWLSHLGAVPVTMTGPEGTPAMQRGAVECATGSAAWLSAFGYKDVTRSILDFTMGSSRGNGLLVMNRDAWNELSPEHKKVFLHHAPIAQAELTIGGYVELDARNLAQAREEGIPIHKGGADFEAKLAEHLKNEADALPAEMKPLGVRDPEAIMAAFLENLEKWRGLSQEIANDRDRFVEALRREIYDRLDLDSL